MTCADLELLLCDYLDGTLPVEQRSAVEAHFEYCEACQSLVQDARAVMAFIERVPTVDPPPALITKIIHQTPMNRPAAEKAKSAVGGLFGKWFQPVLQPRFVMGMAMTILSFAMLGRFAGIEARQLRPADLDPVKIYEGVEDKVHRGWVRTVKYYESLRFVYEIQSRLRELTEPEEDAAAGKQKAPVERPATPGAANPGETK